MFLTFTVGLLHYFPWYAYIQSGRCRTNRDGRWLSHRCVTVQYSICLPAHRKTIYAANSSAARALVLDNVRKTGKRDRHIRGQWPISASSLLRGSRPWNSRIRFSNVLIAAPNSSSLRANSSFFTTRISRTTPSAASSARQSALLEVPGYERRPGPGARPAGWRPPFRSGPRRAGPSCAGHVSRRTRLHRPQRHPLHRALRLLPADLNHDRPAIRRLPCRAIF